VSSLEAQRAVGRRGRIAAHSGRTCANGTRDAPSRLIKLKKFETEETAGLISSGFFVGLLQLGWARGHENAFAAALDIADRHHNRSVVRLRSGRCDSQPSQNNETQPLPDSPPTPFTVVVRTIPITKELAFEERWQIPVTEAMPPTIGLANRYQDVSLQLEPDQQVSQRAERPDPVCGSKGRRYFHIGRILSWRCRR
jgi:hypothetical protein